MLVLAAACMSAYKGQHESGQRYGQFFASFQQQQPSILSAWWPCVLVSVVQFLLLTQASRHGLIPKRFARKSIHMSMGIVYLLFWPTFPDLPLARYVCATVPLCSALLVFLVGTGVVTNSAVLSAATRSGRRQELLQGPLLYGVMHIAVTLLMWRSKPAGIASLVVLCIGDGAAELVGVAFGSTNRLPYNQQKSWAGSVACLVLGGLASHAMLLYFFKAAMFGSTVTTWHLGCVAIASATVGSFSESLTNYSFDNVIVVCSAALAGHLAFLFTT